MTIADYPDRRCRCGNRLSIADTSGVCLECQERPVIEIRPSRAKPTGCKICGRRRATGRNLCPDHANEYSRNYRLKRKAVTA